MTVRLPLPHFPFWVGLSDSADGSGEERTTPGISKVATLCCRPSPQILGDLQTIVMMNLMGGGWLSRPPPPVSCDACIMHATGQTCALVATRPNHDQPRNQNEEEPKKQKRATRGLGANMGHQMAHISHFPSARTRLCLQLLGPLVGEWMVHLYVEIAPLIESAFHILMPHFCNLVSTFRVLMLLSFCSVFQWLCGNSPTLADYNPKLSVQN